MPVPTASPGPLDGPDIVVVLDYTFDGAPAGTFVGTPDDTVRVKALPRAGGSECGITGLLATIAACPPDAVVLLHHDDIVLSPNAAPRLAEAVRAGATYAVPYTNDLGTDHGIGTLPTHPTPDDLAAAEARTGDVGVPTTVGAFRPSCLAALAPDLLELVARRPHDPLSLMTDVVGDTVAIGGAVAAHANRCVHELTRLGRDAAGLVVVANLIVRDEEDNIGPCLDSVAGLVDRVIVADTGSQDRTVELLEAADIDVLHRPWRDDFGWARNEVLDRSRDADWVLWIDADERASAPDPVLLRGYLHAFAAELDVMEIYVNNVNDFEESDAFLAPRLLNAKSIAFEGELHERPVRRSDRSLDLRHAPCGLIELHHFGYQSSAVSSKGKAERNLDVAQAAYDKTRSAKNALDLARSLTVNPGSDPERITALYREGLTGIAPHSHRELAWVRALLGSHLLGTVDDPEAALVEGEAGIALVSDDWGCRAVAASALNRLGRGTELVALHDRLEGARSLRPMTHGRAYRARYARELAAALVGVGEVERAWEACLEATEHGGYQTHEEVALALEVATRRGGDVVENLASLVVAGPSASDRLALVGAVAATNANERVVSVVRRLVDHPTVDVDPDVLVIGLVVDVAGGGDGAGLVEHIDLLDDDRRTTLTDRLTRMGRADLLTPAARSAPVAVGAAIGSAPSGGDPPAPSLPPVATRGSGSIADADVVFRIEGPPAPGLPDELRRCLPPTMTVAVITDQDQTVVPGSDQIVVVVPGDVIPSTTWIQALVESLLDSTAADEPVGCSLITVGKDVIHAGFLPDGRAVGVGIPARANPFVFATARRRLGAPYAARGIRDATSHPIGTLLGGVSATVDRDPERSDDAGWVEFVGESVVVVCRDTAGRLAAVDSIVVAGLTPLVWLRHGVDSATLDRLSRAGALIFACETVDEAPLKCSLAQLVGASRPRAVVTDDEAMLEQDYDAVARSSVTTRVVWVGSSRPVFEQRVDGVAAADDLAGHLAAPTWPEHRAHVPVVPAVPHEPGLVSIVIPVFGKIDLTLACLAAVRATTRVPYEIIVVDDASPDDSAARLAALPDVTLVSNPTNLGFPGAVNQGLAAARGEYVCLLNNDTEPAAGWLDEMLGVLAEPGVEMVAPRSNCLAGRQLVIDAPPLDTTGAAHAWAADFRRRHSGTAFDTLNIKGMCVLTRRRLFEQLGGLDEGFGRGNGEDDELCDRVINAGGRLRVANGAIVLHHGSATFRALDIDYGRLLRSANRASSSRMAGCAARDRIGLTGVVLSDGDVMGAMASVESGWPYVDRIVVMERAAPALTELAMGAHPADVFVRRVDWRAGGVAALSDLPGEAALLLLAGDTPLSIDPGVARAELDRHRLEGAHIQTERGPSARLLPLDEAGCPGNPGPAHIVGLRLSR